MKLSVAKNVLFYAGVVKYEYLQLVCFLMEVLKIVTMMEQLHVYVKQVYAQTFLFFFL